MRYLRFFFWLITAAIASIGQIFFASYSIVVISLAVIAGLLASTPANAIRLPRVVSEILIVSMTILLDVIIKPDYPISRLLIAAMILIFLRLFRHSPWWVVLVAWFPDH